ncbi:MAG: DUF4625 domain-containing protein [Gemmatales bacterium]|nr:DUF4625 domain-containing protein [Gemmatales bacterium]MDW8223219.1 hypothetical protein [Gemmatales bacterium]
MLWQLAFLLTCMTVTQAGELAVSPITTTYGQLGPHRTDSRYIAGDIVFFQFDISGLRHDEAGRFRYVLHLELLGPGNKVIFRQKLPEVVQVRVMGNTKIRQALHIALPDDATPGDYRLQVTVEDTQSTGANRASQSLAFQVVAQEFGIVQFQLFSIYTPQLQLPCPGVGVVGQIVHVTAVVVRGKKDRPDQLWNLDVEMRLLDEQGKPVAGGFPVTGQFRKIPGDLESLDLRFDLPVQRSGKFTISVQATEPGTNRSTKLLVPFLAVDLQSGTAPSK